MEEADRELLEGMGNCYRACGEDFEGTVRMVAHARGLEPEAVKECLARLRAESGDTPTYRRLRDRLPPEFPL